MSVERRESWNSEQLSYVRASSARSVDWGGGGSGANSEAGTPRLQRTPLGRSPSKRGALTTPQDAKLYNLAQGLVPLLNNPAPVQHWPWGANAHEEKPPPLPPGRLTNVTPEFFRQYLRTTAEKYKRFQENREDSAEDAERRISINDFSAPGAGRGSQGEGLVKAMRQVPIQYFQDGFTMSRPETWAEVCPEDTEEARMAAVEELSAYLDVVETHLLKEIAARSDNFFEATTVVGDLRGTVKRTYQQVAELRGAVLEVDSGVVEASGQIVALQRRRANLRAVLERLAQLEAAVASREALALLVAQADYAGALDVLEDLSACLHGQDLAALHAFRLLPAELASTSSAVEEVMGAEFLRSVHFTSLDRITDRIIAHLQAAAARPGGGAGAGAGDEAAALVEAVGGVEEAAGAEEAVAEEVAPLLLGLLRTGSLSAVLAHYREAAAAEVKQGIRDVVERGLPLLLNAGDKREAASLAEKLQSLRAAAFLQLLAAVHAVVHATLTHCTRVRGVIGAVLKASKVARAEQAALMVECGEAVQAISEAAHGRWAKLLGARAAVHTKIQLGELKEVMACSEGFAVMAEQLGAKPVLGLRNAVQLQCKAFLDALHARSLAHLSGLLEQENWVASPVPAHFQQIVDQLLLRAAELTDEGDRDKLPAPQTHLPNGTSPTGNGVVEAGEGEMGEVLVVGAHRFHVVNTALMVLRLVREYGAFQDAVPAYGSEVARRVVELLKVFNSRACQLVLGAGAMQVAGLKSITAKHLALSCQCLGVFIDLHPVLRAVHTGPVPASRKALLGPEFDRVLQDLTIHRSEIHSKLVAIMRERLNFNLQQLPGIADTWAQPQPGTDADGSDGPPPPSNFALANVKQLRTLGQVLGPLLLAEELHQIFGRVGGLFSKLIAETFEQLEPRGPHWEVQCSADLAYLVTCLADLPMSDGDRQQAVTRLAGLLQPGGRFGPKPPLIVGTPPSLTSGGSPRAGTEPPPWLQQHPPSATGAALPSQAGEISGSQATAAGAAGSPGSEPVPAADALAAAAEEELSVASHAAPADHPLSPLHGPASAPSPAAATTPDDPLQPDPHSPLQPASTAGVVEDGSGEGGSQSRLRGVRFSDDAAGASESPVEASRQVLERADTEFNMQPSAEVDGVMEELRSGSLDSSSLLQGEAAAAEEMAASTRFTWSDMGEGAAAASAADAGAADEVLRDDGAEAGPDTAAADDILRDDGPEAGPAEQGEPAADAAEDNFLNGSSGEVSETSEAEQDSSRPAANGTSEAVSPIAAKVDLVSGPRATKDSVLSDVTVEAGFEDAAQPLQDGWQHGATAQKPPDLLE